MTDMMFCRMLTENMCLHHKQNNSWSQANNMRWQISVLSIYSRLLPVNISFLDILKNDNLYKTIKQK